LHSSAEKAENMNALKKKANGFRMRITSKKRRRRWCLVTKHTIADARSRETAKMKLVNTPKTRAAMKAPLKLVSEVYFRHPRRVPSS
jgi:hypothetical protein